MSSRSRRESQNPQPLLRSFTRQSSWANQVNPSAYDPEHTPPTCHSALPHGPDAIRDHVKHYFACIDIAERVRYLDRNHVVWKYEYDFERKAVNSLPEFRGNPDSEVARKEAKRRVKEKRRSIAAAIEAQYRRTEILREALKNAPDPPMQARNGCGHLVRRVEESACRWKASAKYEEGIEEVRRWKRARRAPKREKFDDLEENSDVSTPDLTDDEAACHLPSSGQQSIEPERRRVRECVRKHTHKRLPAVGEKDDYDIERDVNSYLIQYTRTQITTPSRQRTRDMANPAISRTSTSDSLGGGGLEPTDEGCFQGLKGQFPDQRMSIQSLLLPGSNVLSRKQCEKLDPTRIRYFHIPANNMEWIEKAIAAYYDEARPDLRNHHRDPPVTTRTQMLLRPQFWRGQQHGSRKGMVHARYMRPLCERVCSTTDEIEVNPKNIVLFMPYLHWETDRMRNTATKVIDLESEKQWRKMQARSAEKRDEHKRLREGLPLGTKRILHPAEQQPEGLAKHRRPALQTRQSDDLSDLVARLLTVEQERDRNINIDAYGRPKVESPLGQYLIDVARLYEAMSTYRDQQMLEKYLYNDPPLHPRRTLDQSYYWTLKTTKARDRDQVVYRGTSTNTEDLHRLQQKAETQQPERLGRLLERLHVAPTKRTITSSSTEPQWQWTHHSENTDENGCEHCRNNIRKTSQVIMVDQLWMWVLDERTIITSFPRRYGYNKHDLSGVHRSIRARLGTARKNQIRSVYDLALIILDECSNTFFDRIKTSDSQPQVIDIFSEAIGNVTHKHTILFQRVWHWASKASEVFNSKTARAEGLNLHQPFIDIQPEAKLQQEIKDIIDELDMMLHIYKKQREVMRRFCKHVEHILDPDGRWKEGDMYDMNHEQAGNASSEQSQTVSPEDAERQRKKDEAAEKCKQLYWFRMQSRELLSEVDDRIDELEGLKQAAQSTAQSVNDLLSLKQQQASVLQTFESVRQAEETIRQGRAIVVFTIITIIFMPLSFVSSLFGMNNVEFGSQTTLTLHDQFRLMFPISLSVILVSFALAFSPLLRAVIYSTAAYTLNWVLVNTQLYRAWLMVGDHLVAQSVLQAMDDKVGEMKDRVRQARWEAQRRRKDRRAEKEEGRGTGGHQGQNRDRRQGTVENGGSNGSSGNLLHVTEGTGEMHRRRTARRSGDGDGSGNGTGQAAASTPPQSRSRISMSGMRRSFISVFRSSQTLSRSGTSGEAVERVDGAKGAAKRGDENV
ncbi:hypothetical protein C8A03DRAFT_34787 [Achaetomium macrosporum]|uniref:Ankyrin repeat protein n=1 Tax=Achaetomium macrosporum TaxID=79813 RepID=A0AAN7H6F4_9PEZI|nr:hypothetical protein C8A03DRAFT_34787 [Achaetomium macrosporum]